LDGHLHGPRPGNVDAPALLRNPEKRPATIVWIGPPPKEPLTLQALQDSGERARVYVQESGNLTGRDAGEAGHDPDHQSLRPGDPDGCVHPLGSLLQSMIEGPDQPHEIQDLAQGRQGSIEGRTGRRLVVECTGAFVGMSNKG
jgi:hypothetical protein